MAISRLLYSSQTALITVGGRLEGPSTFQFNPNDADAVKEGKDHTGAGPHNAAGFTSVMPYLLPVQSVSVDQTVPQEDVIVMGNLGGVARIQKDVATSKCTIKSYLAEYMSWYDGLGGENEDIPVLRDAGKVSWTQSGAAAWDGVTQQEGWVHSSASGSDQTLVDADTSGVALPTPVPLQYGVEAKGPLPGITDRGFLSGENWVEAGETDYTKLGLLEQLIWESMGGFESRVELFRPEATAVDKDGFSFYGILSSISIDAGKGAYPTLDLAWEGMGEVEFMAMSGLDDTGVTSATGSSHSVAGDHAGNWYINTCRPHTPDSVAIWGREKVFAASAGYSADKDDLILIAANSSSYWQNDELADGNAAVFSGTSDLVGDAANHIANSELASTVKQGNTDVLNTAKVSFDMPSETLSTLGANISGKTTVARVGNRTFSKPPFKASMTLDGHGLILAGHETVDANGQTQSQIIPNEIQVGELHCVIDPDAAAVSSRSFSQSVGDVGASYNVSVEGTHASFYGTYQIKDGDAINANRVI